MGNQNSNDKSCNEFIISHTKNNKHNDTSIAIESFDYRRLVFVDLRGLFKSWRRVPSIFLYTSLLLMPLKQTWIKHPAEYLSEIRKYICVPCGCKDIRQLKEFIRLLQWKHSQGSVLFILDELEVDEVSIQMHQTTINPLVAPFWYKLSTKLESLYDHISNSHYKPLAFDERYWMNKERFISKYNTKRSSILSELYFVAMKPDTMQEIIYQSNPKSLHPVVQYGHKLLLHSHSFPINVYNQVESPLSPILEATFVWSEQTPDPYTIVCNIDSVTFTNSIDLAMDVMDIEH